MKITTPCIRLLENCNTPCRMRHLPPSAWQKIPLGCQSDDHVFYLATAVKRVLSHKCTSWIGWTWPRFHSAVSHQRTFLTDNGSLHMPCSIIPHVPPGYRLSLGYLRAVRPIIVKIGRIDSLKGSSTYWCFDPLDSLRWLVPERNIFW